MRLPVLALTMTLVIPIPVSANPDSDYCAGELVLTEIRLRQTLERLRATNTAPMPQRCAVFREHIRVMSGAARIYGQCMRGHARGENVGQMQGSVADFREIVARNCR
ncbi:hypothetical protein E8L99_21000 [Phreatobacter aquaticus]|uniref:UrcA family protein n=1 Tax=Phreatobacter aquaticus TaxID=2570229 RepID=A0A4D7QSQ0_9HYPH|nr:hypothetical protein [Phreatobacter aquaticus]QCK88057.1 hypothetical protein E8L99_21000 [Phreatobacter aquaticus]